MKQTRFYLCVMVGIMGMSVIDAKFSQAESADHYRDFNDLAQHEKEGVDYEVRSENRHSKVCVLAIHGGKIEEGSDEVAREIAGSDLSYYTFRAKKLKDNKVLHVTSTHFNDPRAFAITSSAQLSVSIHGFKEEEKDIACVGGGNDAFRAWIAKSISDAKLPITLETPCTRFGGSSKDNITNRAALGGVQIELSTHLRKLFLQDSDLLKKFGKAVRTAALSFKP